MKARKAELAKKSKGSADDSKGPTDLLAAEEDDDVIF
jgi:hypothetical protein